MEKQWVLNDTLFMFIFIVLSCGTMAYSASDFVGIVSDLWYEFGNVMMEFGRVVEQLPI